MKLEEIEAEWVKDSKIDRTDLCNESLKIPQLHHKYYKIYIRELVQLKQDEHEFNSFYKLKIEYYCGKCDKETLDTHGWEQFQLTLLKQDIPLYLEADKEIQERKLKLHVQREKTEFLSSIIKTINNRGFVIKNAIDFLKFTNGGS